MYAGPGFSCSKSFPVSQYRAKTAHDLQWSELLGTLASFAVNPATARLIEALRPLPDVSAAMEAQRELSEALALQAQAAGLPVSACPEIADLCGTLQRAGAASAQQFRDAGKVIDQALRLQQHTQHHADVCPELKRALWCDPELVGLRGRIARAIDEHGAVMDSASEGLRSARRQLGKVRQQLRDTGSALLGRYKDSLSGQYVAERGGRFVLPVRAETQGHVPGLILGSSGSGGTLYVEPKELSELNNRVYIAEAEALREEAKVLWELSVSAATLASALDRAAENCLRADKLSAVARWAHEYDCCTIRFADEPVLELGAMRHPLLLGQGHVVANDLQLDAAQCLVVSGPNAGGKTVALKCFGLAVWLAQSGLAVPCDPKSRIGWFDLVLTDIGDEQSISRSLSTFSAHISHLGEYLGLAERGCLVLLDEIAGGTDPDEGAALAASILAGFVARGASVATTTHYERLKRLGAGEDAAFVNASVGFDFSNMLPTFRLHFGVPGQSSALAVAERYGIPQELVAHALELLPKQQLHQKRLLEQLEAERAQLSDLRRKAEVELEEQRVLSEKLRHDAARAREHEQERLRQEAATLTQEVQQARALLRQAKTQLAATHANVELQALERMVNQAANPVTLDGALTQALRGSDEQGVLAAEALQLGMRVRIPHLGGIGEIVSGVSKGAVRVNVGGMKLTVPVDRLRSLDSAPATSKAAPSASSKAAAQNKHTTPRRTQKNGTEPAVASSFAPARTTTNTCDLRGVRVEAGLDSVAAFLDQMLRLGEPAAYILHGHGTGAMKAAVREYLRDSRHVSRWEPAAREDGGDALTLCWL